MTDISPLRHRMIEDMTVRKLSPATQRSYIHAVSKFSRFFGRSPDRLGLEDVRKFQVFLISQGILWPAFNQTVCALRFFTPLAVAARFPGQGCRLIRVIPAKRPEGVPRRSSIPDPWVLAVCVGMPGCQRLLD
jgi:hypothetical protein